jgi:hypothetical protein
MSPPNKRIQYFFSNPLIQAQFLANDSPTMAANSALLAGRDPMFQQLRFLDGTEIPFVPMGHVNFIVTRQEFVVDDKNDYQPLIKVPLLFIDRFTRELPRNATLWPKWPRPRLRRRSVS